MTPQEKAKELVKKFDVIHYLKFSQGKQLPVSMYKSQIKACALIAVDEILNHHSQEQGLYRIDTYYWEQVKAEIEKL